MISDKQTSKQTKQTNKQTRKMFPCFFPRISPLITPLLGQEGNPARAPVLREPKLEKPDRTAPRCGAQSQGTGEWLELDRLESENWRSH